MWRTSGSTLVGVCSGAVVLACLFILHGYLHRTDEPLVGLRLAPNTSEEISALDGDRVPVEFILRNGSDQPIRLSEITTSCTCFVVEYPSKMPIEVPAASEARITAIINARATFEPVALVMKANVQTDKTSKWHSTQLLFKCRPRYRTSPAVVTFGQVNGRGVVKSVPVTVFKVQSQDSIIVRASANDPALSVEVNDVPPTANVPKDYNALAVVTVVFDAEKAVGAFRGDVDVVFSNGDSVSIPVVARVQ